MSIPDNETVAQYSFYTHDRKGTKYVIQDFVQVRDPVTGEWAAGVMYEAWDGSTGSQKYVRTMPDFRANFTRA